MILHLVDPCFRGKSTKTAHHPESNVYLSKFNYDQIFFIGQYRPL